MITTFRIYAQLIDSKQPLNGLELKKPYRQINSKQKEFIIEHKSSYSTLENRKNAECDYSAAAQCYFRAK